MSVGGTPAYQSMKVGPLSGSRSGNGSQDILALPIVFVGMFVAAAFVIQHNCSV
jgi:hypothetical protein